MLLAHLSDPHITTGTLAGLPAEHIYQAIARLQAIEPRPEFVVITGDLVDRGETDEYESALDILKYLDIPLHIVPGNHDHAPRMLQALAKASYVEEASDEPGRCYYRVDYPELRLFCCDSSVLGRHDGELGPTQLAWLDSELSRDPDIPAILAMHHHPVPSGIAVMDSVMLSDTDALARVLLKHPPLTRILIGHLHRFMTTTFAGSLVTCAPSTYRQVFLELNSSQRRGAYVNEPPAFLLHRLLDGQAITHLVPVTHSSPPVGVL